MSLLLTYMIWYSTFLFLLDVKFHLTLVLKTIFFVIDLKENSNFNNIILESDCKYLVDCIIAKKFQNNEAGEIIRNCVLKLSSFQNCCIRFVSRQAKSEFSC